MTVKLTAKLIVNLRKKLIILNLIVSKVKIELDNKFDIELDVELDSKGVGVGVGGRRGRCGGSPRASGYFRAEGQSPEILTVKQS